MFEKQFLKENFKNIDFSRKGIIFIEDVIISSIKDDDKIIKENEVKEKEKEKENEIIEKEKENKEKENNKIKEEKENNNYIIIKKKNIENIEKECENFNISFNQIFLNENKKISIFPSFILNFKNLKILNMEKCFLTQIPNEIINLKNNLIDLNLSYNELNFLPDEFSNLINIKRFLK
jgi:hypothetical protein